ncbi:MAG TPA: HDIG domain-containing protein [Longimicrobiales bacterium]
MDDRFGMREALRALSKAPERIWPDGILHHGVRVALLCGLALVVHLLFPIAPVPDFPVLEKGMVAEEDVIAQVGFPIYKAEADLARERAEAAAGVAPLFEYDPSAVDTMRARVADFLDRIRGIVEGTADETAERAELRRLLQSYGLPTNDESVALIQSPRQRSLLERALNDAIRSELPVGIASTTDAAENVASQIRLRRGEEERLLPRDSLLTAPRFFERAARHLPRSSAAELAELQRLVLIRFFEPSVRLNRDATEAARERARRAVPAIKGEVLKGEKIVGAHEQIRDAELERLQAYQEQLAKLGEVPGAATSVGRSAGAVLYNIALLLIFGLLLLHDGPAVYRNFRHIVLIAALILFPAGVAAVVAGSGWPAELIPIAFPALVVAVLWGGRLALILALVLAVLLAGQTPFLGLSVLFTLVAGGATAALAARVVRRRSQTWIYIAILAAAYVAAAVILGLLRSREAAEVITSSAWGTLNAVASVLIALGFLPLFEAFTRITTDQTLLELSDMNHPLLQRLQREAPGTFSHTLNVANLAEAAARAIGANALLTRVGVYYHDIGKTLKPQYFIENQPQGRNPHDKLKPATSAMIVRNHVVEGLRLAGEGKLPASVSAFIAEHHGTQQISFFYERARELDPDGEFDERDFAYPGPRPQSRETAIVMLADSVESAARVLQDPTPERIRALVDRIVEGKMAQGQLEDAPLTLQELARIKDQFVSGLAGIYHQRIDYPSAREEPEGTPAAAPGAAAGRG